MRTKNRLITVATLLGVLLLSGCTVTAATSAPDALSELVIKASDYTFDGADQIEAGLITVTLINEGQAPHHAQLARLPAGMTPEQLLALFQADTPAALQALTFVGGPGLLDPGLQQQVVLDLAPGTYLVMSFVLDEEGMPYLARGMVKAVEVVAADGQPRSNGQTIRADGTVNLLDFSFVLPDEIAAGEQVWQVVNEGKEPHEIMIAKLADGKGVEDLLAFLQTPGGAPPYANIGGFQALTPGQTGWLKLDLAPGNYVALCYVPGAESGQPHFGMGMIQSFNVQ